MISGNSEINLNVTLAYTLVFLIAGMIIFNFGTYFAASVLELKGGSTENLLVGLAFLISALPSLIMKAVYEANKAAKNQEN